MGLDTTTGVYIPAFGILARPVTITPTASQPGEPAYGARGCFGTTELNVGTEGGVILSSQTTVLDIIEREFTVLPSQGDLVNIPADGANSAEGDFEIIDRSTNGPMTTLTLQLVVTAKP